MPAITTRIIPAFIGALALLAFAPAPAFAAPAAKQATLTSLESNLEKHFLSPDEEAKPWTFWYWMSGNVTKEGITYDLEAMARAGIGGAYIFAIDRPGYEQYVKVPNPATANSPIFWEMVKFAVKEAERLGMRMALNACDGWSLAGGPWITPENSMQKLVSSIAVLDGGNAQAAPIQLARPDTGVGGGQWKLKEHENYYRDIAVLAYPAATGWGDISGKNIKNAQLIKDPELKSGIKLQRFSASRMERWVPDEKVPESKRVPADRIIDLTAKMDAQGRLDWTPPAGKWVVQRFGYTTTGETNRPTSAAGMGLEVDKFNKQAVEFQFKNWWGRAAEMLGPALTGKVLTINHSDSWECGPQNWSPVFRDEFIKRRGYDPVKYLPATTGIPVGSAEESERFLWDFRRTIVDLISDGFFKTSVALTNKAGGLYSSETVSGIITDSLEFYREVDVPMAEFWIASHGQDAIARVASGAHIYGKRFVQTEAFTERGIKWTEDPYFLKTLGDYSYATGVNRYALHVWPHQAFPERAPGVTLFKVYGTVFSGNQPWHDLARSWFDYIRRSQAMLQQGVPFADVCYFIGEELPADAIQRQDLNPALPFGYDYDCINRDALLTRATARNGRVVLPDGVSYSLLVLPNSTRMSPEVAAKIGELASAGVPVIGPEPVHAYSLAGYPESDNKLRQIVAATWGNVRQNITPAALLRDRGMLPDVEFLNTDMAWIHRGKKVLERHAAWNGKDDKTKHKPELGMEYTSPPFASIHRRTKDADFYFLSNQELEPRAVEVALRTSGRQPELWHPETGVIRPLTNWEVRDGRTHIPLQFDPAESYFIVFRNPATPPAAKAKNFPRHENLGAITGAWTVEFQPKRGAPAQISLPALASLSENSDSGVKHYSGVATYRRQITLPPAAHKRAPGERILLDLGQVQNVAEVTLNGKTLPSTWKPPHRIDITDALAEGKNDIIIRVANTWKNRLIGDSPLPVDKRITWTLYREDEKWFNPKEKIIPSGLIGPVTLLKQTNK